MSLYNSGVIYYHLSFNFVKFLSDIFSRSKVKYKFRTTFGFGPKSNFGKTFVNSIFWQSIKSLQNNVYKRRPRSEAQKAFQNHCAKALGNKYFLTCGKVYKVPIKFYVKHYLTVSQPVVTRYTY